MFSEKIGANGAELFAILEFPNKVEGGGTWADYEKATRIVTSALRVNFRSASADSFENFLAQVNAELGTVAADGGALWLSKMNATVAAKYGADLYVSTVGKIHAYLFRQRQFSNIADSPSKLNPAKLFENFVIGRLAKQDVVVLSTSELTNRVSLDRLQQELSSPSIEEATQLIADLMQESAEKDLSVGTIFLAIGRERVSAEQALTSIERESGISRGKRLLSGIESGATTAARAAAGAALQLGTKIREADLRPSTLKARSIELKEKTAEMMSPERFRSLSRTKKFFVSMAGLFIVLAIADIIVGVHLRKVHKADATTQQAFTLIREDITQANSAQTYTDSDQARTLLADAETKFKALPTSAAASTDGKQLQSQLQALDDAINKVSRLESSTLTDFGGAPDRLLLINGIAYVVTLNGSSIADYNLSSHATDPSQSLGFPNLNAAATDEAGTILLKNSDGALYVYDETKNTGQIQKATLPSATIGLSTYANSPIKAYTIANTANGGIISTYINATSYSQTAGDFSSALDIATGTTGAYALLSNNILKFASGQPRAFKNPSMQFGQGSKLFLTATHVYVLDTNAKKIVEFDTSGNLVVQYESDTLTNPKDFSVDEQNKAIYILNGSQLLALPLS